MGRDITTDAEIEEALQRAANEPEPLRALEAKYDPVANLLLIRLNSGRRLAIPREELQDVCKASPEDVAAVELIANGRGLHWEKLDTDFSIEGLAKGIYGNAKWMQSLSWQKQSA